MQINRLLDIVYILLEKKSVTAAELARHFGVSNRTIYRDIDVLSLAHIPVYTEKGKGGGIRLLSDFVLNTSIFNELEQQEIIAAVQSLASLRTTEKNNALNKLSAIFNKTEVDWMKVDYSDWNGNHFTDFKNAILEKRIVEFDYYGTNGEHTSRRVEPVQIWFKARAWYVKGYCLTREAMRMFKLSRVRNIAITNEFFTKRGAHADVPSDTPPSVQKAQINIKVKIAPELAYRVLDEFSGERYEIQPDGSFVICMFWTYDEWLLSFLTSFGEHIEVLEPAELRSVMREKGRMIMEKHR